MAYVHTPLGAGEIVQTETVRGRTQHLVAGNGFRVWLDATKVSAAEDAPGDLFSYRFTPERATKGRDWHPGDEYDLDKRGPEDIYSEHYREGGLETTIEPADGDVNEDNSTTLPYNPSPQYPADMFSHQQTILPGDQKIDADERLSPSDSRTFKDRSDRSWPAPNPDLFAKQANPALLAPLLRALPAVAEAGGLAQDALHGIQDGPTGDLLDPESSYGKPGWDKESAYRRPAGLSSKYIHLASPEGDDPVSRFRRDPVREINARGHLISSEHEDAHMADYGMLVEADAMTREAAWSDVRAKAQRLRSEGRVHVQDVGPGRIYATVDGDNGTYDVMIAKTGGQSISDWICECPWGSWAFKRAMTYVGRLCSHGYATYLEMQADQHKGNPGKFNPRRRTAGVVEDFKSWVSDNDRGVDGDALRDFVDQCPEKLGHDQADDLYDYVDGHPEEREERSFGTPPEQQMISGLYRGADINPNLDLNPGGSPIATSAPASIPAMIDPNLDANTQAMPPVSRQGGRRRADLLHLDPHGMTPDLTEVEGGDSEFTDVEKDERKTTGPDQIMHFAFVDANGNGYSPAKFWHTAAPEDEDALTQLLGVPEPPVAPLATNPMAGGGYDVSAAPGVTGGPNTDPAAAAPAPVDPTGGMMTTNMGLGGSEPAGSAPSAPPVGGGTSPLGNDQGIQGPGIAGNPGGPAEGGNYTVQSGDTLSDIAAGPGGGMDYNDITNTGGGEIGNKDLIYPGQELDLGGGSTAPVQGPGLSNVMGPGSGGSDMFGGGGSNPSDAAGGDFFGDSGLSDKKTSALWYYADELLPEEEDKRFFGDAADQQPSGAPAPPVAVPPELNSPENTNPALTNPVPGPSEGAPPPGTENVVTAPPVQGEPHGGTGAAPGPAVGADPSTPEGNVVNTMGSPGGDEHRQPGAGGGGGGMNFDPSMITEMIGPITEGIGNIAGPLLGGGGLGGALSGLGGGLNFLGSLTYVADSDLLNKLRDLSDDSPDLGHTDSHNDEVRNVVDELRERGYDVSQIVATNRRAKDELLPGPGNWLHEPFHGSGPAPASWISSSEDYVNEHEKSNRQDVTDGDGITKYTSPGKGSPQKPKQGAANDIVRQFQASGGGALAESPRNDGGSFSDNDIVANAQRFLKTAGRVYSQEEQRQLMAESHPLGARNMPTEEDLIGTHYL